MKKVMIPILILAALLLASPSAYDYYKAGLAFEDQKEYLKAIENFIMAIDANPNYFDAYHHLAACYYAIDKFQEALDVLDRGLKLESSNVDFLILKAKTLIRLDRLPDAEAIIDTVIKRNPTFLDAYFLKAEIKIYQGKIDEAFSIYNNLLKNYPDDWKVNLYLYQFYLSLDKEKEALNFLRKALELAPYEATVYEALSSYYFSKGDLNSTRLYLAKLFSIDENNLNGLLLKTYADIFENRPGDAEKTLLDLYDTYPRNMSVLWLLYYINSEGKNWTKAADYLSQALTWYPDDEVVRYTLEETLLKTDDVKFADLRNKMADFNYKWGKYYFDNGYFLKGEILIRRAIRLLPLNQQYRFTLSEIYRLNKATFRQLEQYTVLKDLGYPGISMKMDVLNYALKTSLERRYNITPYANTDSFVRVNVYYFTGNPLDPHYNINSIIASMIYDKMASYYGLTFTLRDIPAKSLEECSRDALLTKADYMLVVDRVEHAGNGGYRITIRLVNPDNLITIATKVFFSTTDFPVLEISASMKDYLSKTFPLRGKVLYIEGNIAIVNIGWMNGLTDKQIPAFYTSRDMKKLFNGFGYDQNAGFQGTGKILEISETLCRVEIVKKDIYSKVNIGDYVLIRPAPAK